MGFVLADFEKALLADIQLLGRQVAQGKSVTSTDIAALLRRYGTSFGELPHYLQDAIDRIDLAD